MKTLKGKILAVDFDDTIVVSRDNNEKHEVEIVSPKRDVVEFVKKFKALGGSVILNTCRHGVSLDKAVMYCKDLGIEFDKINENLDNEVEKWGDCRKIFAHYYLDDKAMKISDIKGFCFDDDNL